MARAYRRVKNCGPVPYPDGSGRMLDDQIVIGDMWEPYVAIGYVVRLDGEADPSMFPEDEAPSSPPATRSSHVGPTVTEMVEEAAKSEKAQVEEPSKKRQPTVMELARAAARKNKEKPATVRAAARQVLRDRKGTRTSDIAGGVEDELRPPDDGAGAEAVDS